MEFHITIGGAMPDPAAVEEVVRGLDASAIVDVDPAGGRLRVAVAASVVELVALLNRAGYPVTPQQVVQLPSICCGGCSG